MINFIKFIKKILFFLILNLIVLNIYAQNLDKTSKQIGIMSFLQIPNNDSEKLKYDILLNKAKKAGIKTLSADIWVWLMFKEKGSMYLNASNNFQINEDKVDNTQLDFYFSKAKKMGLDLDIIISHHKLGGNVGDDGSVDIPVWAHKLFYNYLFNKLKNSTNTVEKLIFKELKNIQDNNTSSLLFPKGVYFNNLHYLNTHFLSNKNALENKDLKELTRNNYHFLSPWLTPYFAQFYDIVAKYFTNYIKQNNIYINSKNERTEIINKIIISVGSASELKFQSYNETRIAGNNLNCHYPNYGEPQFYGKIPIIFFKKWLKDFYKNDHQKLKKLWNNSKYAGKNFDTVTFIEEDFFKNQNAPKTNAYLANVYTFLHDTLKNHLDIMLNIHNKYFEDFRLVVKYPGVYWGPKGNSYALQGLTGHLNFNNYFTYDKNNVPSKYTGLDNSYKFAFNNAYKDSVNSYFQVLKKYPNLEFSFTSAELSDSHDGKDTNIPQTFLNIILNEANKSGIWINIENALEWNLPSKEHMNTFKNNFYKQNVKDATLLRMGSLDNDNVVTNIKNLSIN